MVSNFDQCFEWLLRHEGGFVNHPKDPGGMTNLGVTRKVLEEFYGHEVSEQQMRDLTPGEVKPLYRENYWDRIRGDELPAGVDWFTFDWAVNSGVSRASKALQQIVGATSDGVIGSGTLRAVRELEPDFIITRMFLKRQDFYESLDSFKTFGNGWSKRNSETSKQSMELLEKWKNA